MSRTNRTYTATPERFFPGERYCRTMNNDGASVPPRHAKPVAGSYYYTWEGYVEGAWNRGKAWFKKHRNKLHRLERKRELVAMISDS